MLKLAKNRLAAARRSEEGFTLIELMVVVLIIAVLLAIAIPTFLGAQSKAKDRSAQSSARNSATAANTIYADGGSFTLVTPAEMLAVEPSLTYAALPATDSTGPKNVAFEVDADTLWIATLSETGTCYYLKDDKGSAGTGTQFAKLASGGATCSGDDAQAVSTWAAKW